MNNIDILGFVAALLTTSSFLPQAYKVYKTHRTEDLSLGMFLLFTVGVALWTCYGTLVHATPIILSNMTVFLLSLYILLMKIKHG